MAPLQHTHLSTHLSEPLEPILHIWLANTRVFVDDQISCNGFHAKDSKNPIHSASCFFFDFFLLTASAFSLVTAVTGRRVRVSFSRPSLPLLYSLYHLNSVGLDEACLLKVAKQFP